MAEAKVAKVSYGRGKQPKGVRLGGRKKGTPNKATANIKAAIEEAFNKAGGVDYLVRLAGDDPRTFCALVGKIIPTTISGDQENPVSIKVTLGGND